MALTFLFYMFSAVLLFAAFRVITARNPVHAALYLVLAFFNSAALWMMLEAEFLALALILVYVGAVMVLFLFVIMMLDINIAVIREGFIRFLPVGALVGIVMLAEMVAVVGADHFKLLNVVPPEMHATDYSNTHEIGSVLYTEYLYPFEIASVILLVAIIAAIALTMRRRPETKYQDPAKQVVVKRDQRVRLVKMQAEKKEPGEEEV